MADIDFYTTTRCQLRCTYCYQGRWSAAQEEMYNRMLQHSDPISIDDAERAVQQLCKPGNFVCFTGGEPLINWRWMLEVMERVEQYGVRFGLFTNGPLLTKVPDELIARLSQVQISLDGPAHIHDSYRGEGVYKGALKGRDALYDVWLGKDMMPTGGSEVFARMTVPPTSDLYESILGLSRDYRNIYWQFQNGPNLPKMDVVARRLQLRKAVYLWLSHLRTDEYLQLVPFQNTINALRGLTQDECMGSEHKGCACKAGWDFISVFNDGVYYDCPEQVLKPHAVLGSIETGLERIHNVEDVPQAQHCLECPEHTICGTRCLYYSGGDYCKVILPYIKLMREVAPTVEDLAFPITENFEHIF